MPGGFVRFIALFELGSSVVRPLHCCVQANKQELVPHPGVRNFSRTNRKCLQFKTDCVTNAIFNGGNTTARKCTIFVEATGRK